MNTYELALELAEDPYISPDANAEKFKVLADALRQQADRIAELEKEIDKNFKDGFEAGKLEGWKAHKYHSTPQTKPLSDEEKEMILDIWSKLQPHLFPAKVRGEK